MSAAATPAAGGTATPRILMLGAGGTGGYFGGRLAQAGVDVTFLVRPKRAAALAADGLRIRSPLGDADIRVAHVVADDLAALAAERPFHVVLLSAKAYDLDSAIDAIAPAVGAGTTVLPVLNGLRHYAALDARFGEANVLRGLCFISVVLEGDGTVRHLGTPASVTFGELDGSRSPRVAALDAAFTAAGVDHDASSAIARAQWTKFAFLAALAAATCTMRASIGDIVATDGGAAWIRALYAECAAVAAAAGEPVPGAAQATALATLTAAGAPLKASMLRDLEAGGRTEGAHIVGDMLDRARAAGIDAPALATAWVHLQAYEATR